MITRFALFEGTIADDLTDAFRAAVSTELVPKRRAFPGAVAIRMNFANERDDGAPEFPLILAVDYADREAVTAARSSPARTEGKAATEFLLPRYYTGRIHHHVTTAHAF